MKTRAFFRDHYAAICLSLLAAWFLAATLPYLEDFPLMEWAQPMIAAPAWKLASEGVYGSDMFAGFYGSESHNYDHLPVYPLFLTAAFKIAGLGIVQARMVSVLSGLAVIILTYFLGKRLFDKPTGLLAAAFLCTLRLSLPNFNDVLRLGYQVNASGIPLIDFARVIRFDVMVPVWMIAACLTFLYSMEKRSLIGFFLTGLLSGLATLTHIYGGFIIPIFITLIYWHGSKRGKNTKWSGLIMLGLFIAILPYLTYVMQDLQGFKGQILRHEARVDLFNPVFYWNSVRQEPWRYISWLGGSFRSPVLWPRVGIFALAGGITAAQFILWRRLKASSNLSDKLVFLTLPILAGLLAMFINLKRYPYTVILLPFLAIQLSLVVVWLWKKRNILNRVILAGLLVAITIEGFAGVAGMWQMAEKTTPYLSIQKELQTVIPSKARVLSTHLAWFALPDTDFLSANLIFVLTDSKYGFPNPPSVNRVLTQINPEFIVMEERLLKIYTTDPESLPNSDTAAKWEALDIFIKNNCSIIKRIAAPDYGDIVAFKCP